MSLTPMVHQPPRKRRQGAATLCITRTHLAHHVRYIGTPLKYQLGNLAIVKGVIVNLIDIGMGMSLADQGLLVSHHRHSPGLPSSISTSPSFCCSSACSTVMYPAGRQMLPVVAFQRRTRPSFPAEDKTVLVDLLSTTFIQRVRAKHIPRDVPLNPAHRRPARSRKCRRNVVRKQSAQTCDDRNQLRRSLTTLLLLNLPCARHQVNLDAVSKRAHGRHGRPSRRGGMSVHRKVPMRWW